ncbi:hypothetical protein JCM11641_001950 [Rhodosporidiobolus odoratus]
MSAEYIQLANLLDSPSTRSTALAKLTLSFSQSHKPIKDFLRPILPYLTLPTLLSFRDPSVNHDQIDISPQLFSDLLDYQRDWVTSTECPVELRDEYLVRVFAKEGGKAWAEVKQGMDAVAKGLKDKVKEGLVLEAKKEAMEAGASTGLTSSWAELIPKVNSIVEQIQSVLPPPPKPTRIKYNYETKKSETVEIAAEDEDWFADHYFDWEEQHKGEILIIKGFNAITLVPPREFSPRKVIQIVLVSNPTIFDALAPFDLDACCVGYTGTQAVAHPRATRAFALGGWTGGVNLLDIKLARKLDPTSATVSSRALKYLSRGFSLALPKAALDILDSKGIDLAESIRNGAVKAAKKSERDQIKTDDLAGLAGLLRRRYNKDNGFGKKEAQGADYGPQSMKFMKLVGPSELRYENGGTHHEYWEFQIKLAAQVHGLVLKDSGIRDTPYNLQIATHETAYVAGFDRELILGLKDASNAEEAYAWSKIQHLQYIIKCASSRLSLYAFAADFADRSFTVDDRVPRKLLSLVEQADADMKAIVTSSSAAEGSASPSKKTKDDTVMPNPPTFSAEDTSTILQALDLLSGIHAPGEELLIKPASDLHPPVSTVLAPSIPETFPEPYATERHSYGAFSFGDLGSVGKGKKGSETMEEDKPVKKTSDSLFSPIMGIDGKELATGKEGDTGVWKVATLGGLWMFKGLGETIDKVRDPIWQANVLTARAATTLPSGVPFWLLATPGNPYPDDETASLESALRHSKGPQRDALLRYLAQPTIADVLGKMEGEVKKLERCVGEGEGKSRGGMKAAGVWDDERERFLRQWVMGEVMI